MAAALTLLRVVLPVVGLLGYAALVLVGELTALVGSDVTAALLARLPGDPRSLGALARSPDEFLALLENPARLQGVLGSGLATLGRAANALTHLALAFAFAFFLLRDDHRVSAWFQEDVASGDDVTRAYLAAVDADLQNVYFGNVLTVLAVGAAALALYHGFNLVSPPPPRVPAPTLLALLTGLATFVPLVVGKLVYLPTAGYLVWPATTTDAAASLLSWVLAFLVAAVLVLDLLPMTLVQPYLAGRSLHGGLVLFGYVLGAALLGWYGLFLGPLVVVLVVQVANVVLPELLRGESLTPTPTTGIGSDPGFSDGESAAAGGDPAEDGADSEERSPENGEDSANGE